MTASNTTIEALNAQAELIAKLRDKDDEASRARKDVANALEAEETKMIEMLSSCDLTSFKSKYGHAIITHRTSVKTPKTPEAQAMFKAWLKNNHLEHLLTVNSNSLNALYKDELEAARERGDSDFSIPGIDEVTIKQSLMFKKV
jgi:hypothetical protein